MSELVLFDFDGTLARTLPAIVESYRHAFAEVLGERFPGDDPADLQRVLTVRFTEICQEAAGERAPILVESFRDHYRGGLAAPVALYDGVREALEQLDDRGVAVGVVTNKTRFALDLELSRTGLAELPFAALVAADDTAESKPHPRPLLLACERAGIAAPGCFYVGDAPHDMAAARAAGMHGVGALWGDFPEADLREAEPWALAAEPAALPELLTRPTTVSNHPG